MTKFLLKLYYRIRFGKVKHRVKAIDSGCVSEVEILNRNGKVVGYWAYGSYDPSYPYKTDEYN